MQIVLLVAVLLCAGCQNPRNWAYTPEPPRERAAPVARSVAVPPATDQRIDENANRLALYLIPLMPYGWMDYSRPETANQHVVSSTWQFRPDEDIAKAVAAELQNSGLYREAFYTARASEGDLVMNVTIESTRAEGKMITYGLSIYGPLLWLIGFPAGTADNELRLAFELTERATKRSLWSGSFERSYDAGVYWIYSLPSDFEYDNLLKDIMLNDVLPALEQLPDSA
jgi:hypothetical protein